MNLSINTRFAFHLSEQADVLLQFEAAATSGQSLLTSDTKLTTLQNTRRVAAQDNVGERLWIRGDGLFEANYASTIRVDRSIPDFSAMEAVAPQDMPAETTQYLFDSRYCPADQFQPFVSAEFAGTSAGPRIEDIRDWIAQNFTYQSGTSDTRTDARDSFIERRGICRDYAHVMVTLARASGIPARYVAGYAPQVDPPDFHAVAEVYLHDPASAASDKETGGWHMLDPTGMSNAASFAKIGVGRDAADVSFLTAFGPCKFLSSAVQVSVLNDE